MNANEMKEILEKHRKWLRGEPDGARANLRGANLRGAYLRGADLSRAKNVPFVPTVCPDVGGFIAWKKVQSGLIVKLEIPEDARRSSATGRKCRADKARVLAIENPDGSTADVTEAASCHDHEFIYRVGGGGRGAKVLH